MKETMLKNVKRGEFFTLKRPVDENDVNFSSVWVKDVYDKSSKKYDCYKYSDINHFSEMKSTRKVWVGFTF